MEFDQPYKILEIMKVSFKTFQAANGDCIFFTLKEADKQFTIMVDCGRYSKPIKDYIENQLNKHIDLLVVTHIDVDHIEGVVKMLNDIPDLNIDEIWFNSYKRTNDEILSLSEKQIVCLKRLYGKIPQVIDVLDTKVNAEHAMTLSETILGNPKWKCVWIRERIHTNKEDCLLCDGVFGKLRVLSPTQKDLHDLDEEFLSLFYDFFYGEHPDCNLDKDATIYELLLRVAQDNDIIDQIDSEKIASQILNEQVIIAYGDNKTSPLTLANKASIAFVWEMDDHKVLFLGDASPDVVSKSLDVLYGTKNTLFDAVKVSHHGSAHSTTIKMMEKIDSPHFFFTGGGGNKRPHIEAISRIICRPLQRGVDSRMLHFNYKNEWTDGLEKDELQKRFCYSIDYNSNELTYEF